MLTLSNAQNNVSLKRVLRVSPTGADGIALINEACSRLMTYGDWWATVQKVAIVGTGKAIIWPNWVGTVLAVNHRRDRLHLTDRWASFMPMDASDFYYIASHYQHRERGSGVGINNLGFTPVSTNIPANQAKWITPEAADANDFGKTLVISGINGNGTMSSETLTLANSQAPSLTPYSRILKVTKQLTDGDVALYYADDQAGTNPVLMATYGANETNPEYRITEVTAAGVADDATEHHYTALVKMKHMDVAATTDVLPIQNIAAIKLMVMSIHHENAAESQAAELDAQRAIHELNRELNDRLPEFQTPVAYEPFGGANINSHSAF